MKTAIIIRTGGIVYKHLHDIAWCYIYIQLLQVTYSIGIGSRGQGGGVAPLDFLFQLKFGRQVGSESIIMCYCCQPPNPNHPPTHLNSHTRNLGKTEVAAARARLHIDHVPSAVFRVANHPGMTWTVQGLDQF